MPFKDLNFYETEKNLTITHYYYENVYEIQGILTTYTT